MKILKHNYSKYDYFGRTTEILKHFASFQNLRTGSEPACNAMRVNEPDKGVL